MDFKKSKTARIRETFGNETFIQELLADDPTLLGLGDLYLRGKERVQPSSGRLDLLYESPDEKTWYEVEVQLGATDESHIIRTIEYWDNERNDHPDRQHVAVIVAEKITSRFFNVIALFNQHIPIIAIQMSAIEIDGNHTINFTKILDRSVRTFAKNADEVFEPTDRNYWVKRTSEQSMRIADEILQFAHKEDPSSSIKYNKGYIAIKTNNDKLHTENFMSIRPRKKEIRVSLLSPKNDGLEAKLSEDNIRVEYEEELGKYRFYFSEVDYPKVRELLRNAIQFAYGALRNSPENSYVEVEE